MIRPFALAAVLASAAAWLAPAARAQVPSTLDVRVLGFADVDYVETNRPIDDGFVLGQLVGHVSAALSEHVSFFTEVSATARPDQYRIEVERAILRYDFNDWLKVSGGRYHTPVNYWNTAFHHGLWLQTTVRRPEMIRFGTPFQPVHFIGLLVEGSFPTTPLGFGYAVGLGNGRGDDLARGGDAGDTNNHRSWLGQAYVRPADLFGLQIGAAVYVDRVETDDVVPEEFDERIFSAHLAWLRESPEFLGEIARVEHESKETEAENASNAYYAQLAYRLPGRANPVKPYVRYERVDQRKDDPVFLPFDLEYEGTVVGLRFDFTTLAALKAEYRRERFEEREWFDSLYIQVSLAFGETGVDAGPAAGRATGSVR